MLFQYGIVTVDENWKVVADTPIGFSRVYYVYDGNVEYSDKFETKKLKKNHIYIFPSNSPYSITNNMDNPLSCLFLHLDFFPSIISSVNEININDHKLLFSLFETIRQSIIEKNIYTLNMLSDVFINYVKREKIIIDTDKTIAKAVIFISNNYKSKISIEDISNISGYNSQYFIKLFKKNTGITPHQYIIDFRLKEALKLLQTNKSVTEIATETGYTDVKVFSLAFKKKFNLPPNKYRQIKTTYR